MVHAIEQLLPKPRATETARPFSLSSIMHPDLAA
jgi:hypothetical protein